MTIRVEYAGLNFVDVLARRGVPVYFTGWPFVPGMEVGGTSMPWAKGWTLRGRGPGGGIYRRRDRAGGRRGRSRGSDRAGSRGLDLATATTIPLTWATAFGLVGAAHAGAGEYGAGEAPRRVGFATASCGPARCRPRDRRVRSPAQAATLAAAYTPVTQGEDFVARALHTAGVPGSHVVLESIGGSVLASVLGGLAVGGQVVSYGAAAAEPDPEPPPVPDLRTQNLTITGFSILNRARKAPPKALSLIQGVLALPKTACTSPHRPSWTGLRRSMRTSHKAKDAAAGKQSYVCDTFSGRGKAHQPPLPGSPSVSSR